MEAPIPILVCNTVSMAQALRQFLLIVGGDSGVAGEHCTKVSPMEPVMQHPLTIATIRSFQQMKHLFADGRVDPTGPTLQALSKYSSTQAAVTGHQGYVPLLVCTS